MKIAFVSMFYTPTFGGVEVVIQELAERYVKQGHEVHMFCCDSDKYKRIKNKEEIINGVHVHRSSYWFRLSLSTFIWPGLLWQLSKYQFDVIHSHVGGHAYVLFAGLVSRLKGTAHVHTTHCPWTDAFRPWKVKIPLFFTNIIFNRLAFAMTDKIIAITPWEVPTLKKWVNKKKIVVIPNGMDQILFEKIKPNNYKKKLGIKNKMVLFFGRLNPTKGPEHLAIAAQNILKKRKDIDFVFVGPDEGRLPLLKKIANKHPKIHITGAISGKKNIAEMYQAADVYVLPSYREGLPLTLFEAMASGLPIIASPVNGIPYEMKDPENGLFIKYGNVPQIEEAILKILDNPSMAKKMSEANMKKAKAYTWDAIAKRTMQVYIDTIRRK
ncbi:MAG: glycosyltransferase family 4 protein [archaeon]